MAIDNTETIRKHLVFKSDFDRYVVHVIKRAKDEEGRKYGVNETNRLIKTLYVSSVEYFDRKIPVIKDLCDSNNARAYVLPQVRNNSDCLRELLKIVVDNLDNPTIKPDHLVRSAYCGYHGSREKRWIFDLDSDNMTEYKKTKDGEIEKKPWTVDEVAALVGEMLEAIGKNAGDTYVVPTKHGHCLVTPTFDLQKAYKKCCMLFQGVSKIPVEIESTGPGEYRMVEKNVNGWLIKDGMVLMYCP